MAYNLESNARITAEEGKGSGGKQGKEHVNIAVAILNRVLKIQGLHQGVSWENVFMF